MQPDRAPDSTSASPEAIGESINSSGSELTLLAQSEAQQTGDGSAKPKNGQFSNQVASYARSIAEKLADGQVSDADRKAIKDAVNKVFKQGGGDAKGRAAVEEELVPQINKELAKINKALAELNQAPIKKPFEVGAGNTSLLNRDGQCLYLKDGNTGKRTVIDNFVMGAQNPTEDVLGGIRDGSVRAGLMRDLNTRGISSSRNAESSPQQKKPGYDNSPKVSQEKISDSGETSSPNFDANCKSAIENLIQKHGSKLPASEKAELKKALEGMASGNLDDMMSAVPCTKNAMGSDASRAFESILREAGFRVKDTGFEAKEIDGAKLGSLTISKLGEPSGLRVSYSKGPGRDATEQLSKEAITIDSAGKVLAHFEDKNRVSAALGKLSSSFRKWLAASKNN